VAWDADGNIFVTDGYGNSRIVNYGKNGRFVARAGTKGAEPVRLNLAHSLAVDAKG
jgi:hypothetical protein